MFTVVGCVALPAILLGTFFSVAWFDAPARVGEPAFGFDFRAVWRAAGDVLEGQSPYPPATPSALAGEGEFVYPPLTAVLAIPLRLVSFHTAAVLFGFFLIACVFLTLRLLGVRDWRCYGFVFLWVPVLESIRLGAISLLLTFGAALAWRYRNHRWIAPAVVGLLVAAKIFLWPLLIWLFVTGRARQAIVSIAIAAVGTFGAWAAIGFHGLRDYPALLQALTDLLAWKSYSLVALGTALELSPPGARFLSMCIGAAVIVAVVFMRQRAAEEDSYAFIGALGAALALSPIVWTHYFTLLLIPIALVRPRLAPLWALPLAIWLSPNQSDGELWRIALGVGVASAVFSLSLRAEARERERQPELLLEPVTHA